MSGDNAVQLIQNLQVSNTDTTSMSNGDSTSASKLPSALSPHVPEFVPKSVALEREIKNQSYNNKPARNTWIKTVNEEEMERNWRLRPRNDEQQKSHSFRREFKDVGGNVNDNFKEECDSSQGKSCPRHGGDEDSTSGKRWRRGIGSGVGEEQQRGMRRGYARGRGRGRSAWINDGNQSGESTIGNKDINAWLSNNEHKSIRGCGRGRGVQLRPSQMGNGDKNEHLDVRENVTTQGRNYYKLKKEIEKSDEDGKDGWIFVGNKKKMESEKEEGRTEAIGPDFSGKKFKKLNVISKREEKSSQMFERENRKGSGHEKRIFSYHGREDADSGRKQIGQEKNPQEKNPQEKYPQKHENNSTDQPGYLSRKLKDKIKNLDTSNEEQPKMEKKDFQELVEKRQSSKQRGIIHLKKSIDSSTGKFSGNNEEAKEKPALFELQNNEGEFPDLASSAKSSASLSSDWLSGGNRMPIISYSAALKAIPRPTPMPSTATNTTKQTTENPNEDGNNNNQNKKKKKKKKKEKTQEEKVEQAAKLTKKTKQPMQFDLGDWLSSIEKVPKPVKKDKQKITIAGGVLQMKLKDAPTVARATASGDTSTINTSIRKQPQGLHNILDSTAPVIKRGKEREIPKKKKPSQLKKIILKEREEKKKALDTEQQNKEQEEDCTKSNCDSQEAEESEVNEEKSTQDKNAIPEESITEDDVTVHQSPSDDADCPVAPSEDDVRAHIHSRRFREYCDHVMDKQLNNTTTELLQKLVVFQDRQYHKDPIKSKAKRRFVVGLREVTKHLKLRKIKLVIISPNVERIKSAGGLDDTLHNIISIAHQNGVPVVFALRRQVLGRILHKKVPVSAIGVFSYDGAQDQFKELMDFTEKARAIYAERWQAAYDELVARIQRERAIETSCENASENERKSEEIADEHGSSSDKENSENECGRKNEMENGEHREPSSDKDKQSDIEESIVLENSKKNAREDGVAVDLMVQDL